MLPNWVCASGWVFGGVADDICWWFVIVICPDGSMPVTMLILLKNFNFAILNRFLSTSLSQKRLENFLLFSFKCSPLEHWTFFLVVLEFNFFLFQWYFFLLFFLNFYYYLIIKFASINHFYFIYFYFSFSDYYKLWTITYFACLHCSTAEVWLVCSALLLLPLRSVLVGRRLRYI